MAWPWSSRSGSIVELPLVLVPDHHADWCAKSLPALGSREDCYDIAFLALRCQCTLPRATPSKLRLNIRFCQRHICRHTIHNTTNSNTMGLAKCRDAEQCSKGAHFVKNVRLQQSNSNG